MPIVNGLMASETDPLGNTTDYAYNIRDWLISTRLPDRTAREA